MTLRALPLLLTAALWAPFALAQDDGAPPPPEPDAPGAETPAAPKVEAPTGVPTFPMEIGRSWSYRVTFAIQPVEGEEGAPAEGGDDGDHRLDVSVARPLEVGGRLAAAVEWKLDQDLAQRSYFVVEDGFLRCVKRLQGFAEHVKEFPLSPAQPVLPAAELTVGQKWDWEGRAGASSGKQASQVLRQEKVEVPAGTFDAFVVETSYTGEDDSRGTLTRWVVPGVGVVKEISDVRDSVRVFRTQGVLVRFDKP